MGAFREIKHYNAIYYGGGSRSLDGKYKAWIDLRGEDRRIIGSARFHSSRSTLPDGDSATPTYMTLHYYWEDYPQIMDMLRNEEPVYMWINERAGVGGITTSMEPVGEEETD